MLDRNTKIIVRVALRAAGVDAFKIQHALDLIEDKDRVTLPTKSLPILVTQGEAARLSSVSRFTIRKMASAGKLRPVELLPGLTRYRTADLLAL